VAVKGGRLIRTGGLVVGVVSTILIIWMAGVKESYWERDRIESAERVASLTVQGDQLRKDTAEANARAAEADLARVKLEEKLAPRRLTPEQGAVIGKFIQEHMPNIVFAVTSWDAEARAFARQISFSFRKAANTNLSSWVYLETPRGSASQLFIPGALDNVPMNKGFARSNELLGPLKEVGFTLHGQAFSSEYPNTPVLYIAPKEPPGIGDEVLPNPGPVK
jgi:hypothetical protein